MRTEIKELYNALNLLLGVGIIGERNYIHGCNAVKEYEEETK